MASRTETTLDGFLEFVLEARGFDFTGYKRSSIERRVAKRMSEVGVQRYEDHTDYLELHPEEFAALFNAILINVTGFFRDSRNWEYLASDPLPELIRNRPPDSPLRVWSAGCASGEEAYTLAMVMARVLGDRPFQDRVKIYATDVDEDALDTARHGAYSPQQLEDVPREALERFFERTDQRYVFRKDLRRCVISLAQRPRAGRADLADRLARVPQRAHVLHCGDPGSDPTPVSFCAERRRPSGARQVREADHPQQSVHAG